MGAQNFAQIFNFLVHAVEHLTNGVNFHFAALEALQRKADGKVLRELNQHRLIGFGAGSFCRKFGERLLQNILRTTRQC